MFGKVSRLCHAVEHKPSLMALTVQFARSHTNRWHGFPLWLKFCWKTKGKGSQFCVYSFRSNTQDNAHIYLFILSYLWFQVQLLWPSTMKWVVLCRGLFACMRIVTLPMKWVVLCHGMFACVWIVTIHDEMSRPVPWSFRVRAYAREQTTARDNSFLHGGSQMCVHITVCYLGQFLWLASSSQRLWWADTPVPSRPHWGGRSWFWTSPLAAWKGTLQGRRFQCEKLLCCMVDYPVKPKHSC